MAGWPDYGFVINKQMAFLQILAHNNYFLFSKHLDTMSNVTDCVPGQTDLCLKYDEYILLDIFVLVCVLCPNGTLEF